MDDALRKQLRKLCEETERETQRLNARLEQIVQGPTEGPGAPTDTELLQLVSDLFGLEGATPFSKTFDPVIERLSFTARDLDALDADRLKTAWSRFLDDNDWYFDAPENLGLAQWYESRNMISHAIAVYEYLYLCSFVQGDENIPRDFCDISTLLWLCGQRNLFRRARHFCEVIEDLYLVGEMSLESYADAVLLKKELDHWAVGETFDGDRRVKEQQLALEHGVLFDTLHRIARGHLVYAEVWSSGYWRKIEPGLAVLHWAKAIEAEFHFKVYESNKRQLDRCPEFKGPSPDQKCTVGQIKKLLEYIGSNVGLRILSAKLRGGEWLASQEALNPLGTLQEHRNSSAHANNRPYTEQDCRTCLAAIRESGWIWKFLRAIQPGD